MVLTFLAQMLLAASAPTTGVSVAKVGDTYEIVRQAESATQSDGGSSGTSHDRDTVRERVIGVRADGLELEYDLPKSASQREREQNWQFPARVFKPYRGPSVLLNGAELERRVDAWLKAAKWPREVCGSWAFTWTAIHIDCDPQSVLEIVAQFDLRPADLSDAAPYSDPDALTSGRLKRTAVGRTGQTFSVEFPIDPDKVRRQEAESDVVVGKFTGKPVTLEDAMRAHGKDAVSGTITTTFEADLAGNVRRRTKVVRLNVKGADGKTETRTSTETVERHLER